MWLCERVELNLLRTICDKVFSVGKNKLFTMWWNCDLIVFHMFVLCLVSMSEKNPRLVSAELFDCCNVDWLSARLMRLGIWAGNRWVGHAQWRLVQGQHADHAASERQSDGELTWVGHCWHSLQCIPTVKIMRKFLLLPLTSCKVTSIDDRCFKLSVELSEFVGFSVSLDTFQRLSIKYFRYC